MALGVGPEHAEAYDEEAERFMRSASASGKLDAIGSCGLRGAETAAQVAAFERQATLARELDVPLIVEARNAHRTAFQVVQRIGWPPRLVLRAFDASLEELADWIDAGAFVSLGAESVADPARCNALAQRVPEGRLLVESGAPDCTVSTLDETDPRCDQVAFVADALRETIAATSLAQNFASAFRA